MMSIEKGPGAARAARGPNQPSFRSSWTRSAVAATWKWVQTHVSNMGATASHILENKEPPATMRRIVCTLPAAKVEDARLMIEEVAVPVPKSGEVLIKVAAAPVNPSDYGKMKKILGPDEEWKPAPMGNEGSGVVVASGGGMMADRLVGLSVGFVNLVKQGSWSEFVTASALTAVFPMPQALPVESAASFYVNPYTAYAIVDTCRQRGGTGFVHTGASSQLGQMLVKYCQAHATDMTLLNVVRREQQAATLRALGAKHVLVSTGDDWKAELKRQVKALGLTIAFDCVAGEMTEVLVDALPKGSTCFVYGRLSGEPAHIAPIDLIYFSKAVEGFLVAGSGKQAWIDVAARPLTSLRRLSAAGKAVNMGLGEGGWAATRFADCTLDTMHREFLDMWHSSGFTDRKLRIRFQQDQQDAAQEVV